MAEPLSLPFCSGDECAAFIVPAVLVFFAGMWVVASFLLAALAGWRRLAEKYAVTDHMPSGESINWQSGTMGHGLPVNYKGCLNLTLAPEGLGLATVKIFSFGHPKLFIPWGDLEISEGKNWFGKTAVVRIRDTGQEISFRGKRLVTVLLEKQGGLQR